MNKKQIIYGILLLAVVVATPIALWEFGYFSVSDKTEEEKKEVSSNVNIKEEVPVEAEEEHKDSGKVAGEEKIEKIEEKDITLTKKEGTKEGKVITEELNQKKGKSLVVFKDGSTILESEINEEMGKLPEQISSKMSLNEVKLFLSSKAAFDKVMLTEAKKENLDKNPKVIKEIESKQNTVIGMAFLNDKANELMTDEALKAHYDKVWEESFKGTKEYDIKVMTTSDKVLAEKIKKQAKDLPSLNKILESNKEALNAVDLDKMVESTLPVEIAHEIKTLGANAFIGPLFVRGTYVLFFVKKVSESKKQEFSAKFKEDYKKVAKKDFSDIAAMQLCNDYKVKFFDINGKEIDIKQENEKIKKRIKENSPLERQFNAKGITDATVLARIGSEDVTADKIKKFFKLKSLQDEALITMAQQFHMTFREILIHATKLFVEDKICTIEAKNRDYLNKEELKEKFLDLEKIEIINAYFKKHVNLSSEQVKKTYDEFLRSIPEEDKNDCERATKVMFFETKEEAEKTLALIRNGSVKANDLFRKKEQEKAAIDLKYVNKRTIDANLWSIIKKSAVGTCYKEVIEIEGEKFGIPDKDYIIIYVGDKRQITLPSLSNNEEKKYFEAMTKQRIATDIATNLLLKNVSFIMEKNINDLVKDQAFSKMLEAMVIGNQL